MTTIRKADFYYGSLLSVFINNGLAPAMWNQEKTGGFIQSQLMKGNMRFI